MGIYPRDAILYHKTTCSTVFIAALIIIARNLKEPSCPSIKEWTKKIHIYTLENYYAGKMT